MWKTFAAAVAMMAAKLFFRKVADRVESPRNGRAWSGVDGPPQNRRPGVAPVPKEPEPDQAEPAELPPATRPTPPPATRPTPSLPSRPLPPLRPDPEEDLAKRPKRAA